MKFSNPNKGKELSQMKQRTLPNEAILQLSKKKLCLNLSGANITNPLSTTGSAITEGPRDARHYVG